MEKASETERIMQVKLNIYSIETMCFCSFSGNEETEYTKDGPGNPGGQS
jgi:hypothetical protein